MIIPTVIKETQIKVNLRNFSNIPTSILYDVQNMVIRISFYTIIFIYMFVILSINTMS